MLLEQQGNFLAAKVWVATEQHCKKGWAPLLQPVLNVLTARIWHSLVFVWWEGQWFSTQPQWRHNAYMHGKYGATLRCINIRQKKTRQINWWHHADLYSSKIKPGSLLIRLFPRIMFENSRGRVWYEWLANKVFWFVASQCLKWLIYFQKQLPAAFIPISIFHLSDPIRSHPLPA